MNNSAIWNIAPLQNGKDFITSLTAVEGWAWGYRWNFCAQREIVLEYWIGSHLIREPLGMSGLKEGAAGAVEG
jgi:hypothetical protein